MGTYLKQALKAFNLFRLLEKKTMEMFSMVERNESKRKFGGAKVCEASL